MRVVRVRRIGSAGERRSGHHQNGRKKNLSRRVHECLRFHETDFPGWIAADLTTDRQVSAYG
jgi:hypothetical protein